jgi:murein DD-endopeptidase MepM/ murein hydrolase activator NlpD
MPSLPCSPVACPPLWRSIAPRVLAVCLVSLACGGRHAAHVAAEAGNRSPAAPVPPEAAGPAATGFSARGRVRGVYHTLEPGQTLYAIARSYGVTLETLIRVNRIADPSHLPEGLAIFIPGAPRTIDVAPTFTPASDPGGRPRPDPPDFAPPGDGAETTNASLLSLPSLPGGAQGAERPPGSVPAPPPRGPLPRGRRGGHAPGRPSLPALAWPLRGVVTSAFGRERRQHAHHEGIDIDGEVGEPILAAAAGTVVRAGWEGGYGRLVVLDHGLGLTTLYAHASRLLVEEGDRVEAGDEIAEVGESGHAHGSHLHFEVHRDDRPVNPLPYLQARRKRPAQGPIDRPSSSDPRESVPK